MAIDHQTNNSHPLSTHITRSTRPLPQMKYSLDDWPKTGKRPMTVTIIDTSPPVTKLMAIKDFLMIYLWDIISGQVAGNAIEFSRRAQSHHHGAEERLRADPADGHRHLHGEPRWHLHRPRRHQGHLGIQPIGQNDSKDGKKPAHVKPEHFLHAVRQRGYSESPPVNVMLNVIACTLAPLGIKVLRTCDRATLLTTPRTPSSRCSRGQVPPRLRPHRPQGPGPQQGPLDERVQQDQDPDRRRNPLRPQVLAHLPRTCVPVL